MSIETATLDSPQRLRSQDAVRLAALSREGVDARLDLGHSEPRFTLYVAGERVSLSRVVPILHSLGAPGGTASEKITEWERVDWSRLSRARSMLTEIFASSGTDLPTLTVAVRQLRTMVGGTRREAPTTQNTREERTVRNGFVVQSGDCIDEYGPHHVAEVRRDGALAVTNTMTREHVGWYQVARWTIRLDRPAR